MPGYREALTCPCHPGSHHARTRKSNGLSRSLREIHDATTEPRGKWMGDAIGRV
jgi:hypothetical protein